MLMDIRLPRFDIYYGTISPNCFKSYANSLCPDFFTFSQKNVLPAVQFSSVQFSSVQSEMYVVRVNSFLPDNLSEGKKIIFRPAYKMCLKCKYQLKPITISRHMVETKPWNWLKVYSLKYGFEVSKPLIWDITQNSFYVLLQKCLTFSS